MIDVRKEYKRLNEERLLKNENDYMNDKEYKDLVSVLAGPVFKYFLRRMNKEITNKHQDMPIKVFSSIFLDSIAVMNANFLRWLEAYIVIETKKEIYFDQLKELLIKKLDDCTRQIKK